MAKLAKFLDKYDTIIFDMDGVVTSEENYWTAAALTVWECLFNDSAKHMLGNAKEIRKKVLCNDKLISLLKGKGVNSNWDLSYIIYAVCKIYNTDDFNKVLDICSGFSDNILDEYDVIAEKLTHVTGMDGSRNGSIWTDMMMCFQEWYLGGELFSKLYKQEKYNIEKKGLICDEMPIIESNTLNQIYATLAKTDKRLAIATGRPSAELITPLKNFGIYEYFASDGIITYDNVIRAEHKFKCTLSKPHPYVFVKAMLGENFSDSKILDGKYDNKLIKKTLIVGDAGSDMMAAKAIGADFCAVLTGVSGKAARGYFEEQNTEYILDSLADFII